MQTARIVLLMLLTSAASAQQQRKGRVFTNDDVQQSSPAVQTQTQPGQVAPAEPAPSRESLLSEADSVFEEMSHITGLPIKAPLKKRVVNRDELRQVLEDIVRAEYTPQMIHEQDAALKAFGIVPADFDLKKFMINFYTEQAAGLYDPRSKTMLLADWMGSDVQEVVLRHELTHALQDQNFDLDKFARAELANDDATGARQAVAEGYATAAMLQQMLGPVMKIENFPSLSSLIELSAQMQLSDVPVLQNAPFFLRFEALFPYTQGVGFAQQGLAQGGWARLNRVFAKPPEMTREIFQPQLYFGASGTGGEAVIAKLPRPKPLSAVPGLQFVTENIMGELGYYALIGQFISEQEAQRVADALTADRYLVYENSHGPSYTLVAVTRWTSPEAARAFFQTYQTVITKKFLQITPDSRSTPDQFLASTKAGQVLLVRKGNECVWAEGVPAAQADAMIEYLRQIQ